MTRILFRTAKRKQGNLFMNASTIKKRDTGYLYIEAQCHIKGYEEPVYTEMVLKVGEPFGNGLIISIDL